MIPCVTRAEQKFAAETVQVSLLNPSPRYHVRLSLSQPTPNLIPTPNPYPSFYAWLPCALLLACFTLLPAVGPAATLQVKWLNPNPNPNPNPDRKVKQLSDLLNIMSGDADAINLGPSLPLPLTLALPLPPTPALTLHPYT